jgi:hypothetical protein
LRTDEELEQFWRRIFRAKRLITCRRRHAAGTSFATTVVILRTNGEGQAGRPAIFNHARRTVVASEPGVLCRVSLTNAAVETWLVIARIGAWWDALLLGRGFDACVGATLRALSRSARVKLERIHALTDAVLANKTGFRATFRSIRFGANVQLYRVIFWNAVRLQVTIRAITQEPSG